MTHRTLDLMVDIDEVIMPLIDTIHLRAQDKGYHDGSVEPTWRGWEAYGITEDAYWELWTEFADEGGYVSTAPIPGAAEALRGLAWEGHRIHLVTARGFMAHAERIREWTPQWVEEFAIPHVSLTFARNKRDAMEALGVHFDSAIDDSPRNYADLDSAGVLVYLQDHAHNRTADVPAERRVPNLAEWAYRIEKEIA